ncbi:MAG TPA: protein kinase [Pyrinomonadaceae bacterium]|nr:protein kinase [Pyrinomonadaceae bacterium]
MTCPTDQVSTKATLPGPCLLASRYFLEKRLGRGAMGQVYLARDQNLQTRRVAVKTVRPDILNDEDLQEGEAIARFEREARAAASIRHPNVVDVSDFGKSAEGVFFLVMEYVEGETLYNLLRREGTINPQRAANILRQVVSGVEAAHDEGILHRDLKPANIFLMQQKRRTGGEDGFVKVGDFGLAKIVNADRSDLTSGSGPASRGIIGTPEYMAPEQMQQEMPLDARADIYALGTIAYHMLGGRPPFTGNITQLIAQKLMQAPPSLAALRSDVDDELEAAVMKALAKEPADRPNSATEWFEIFERAVSENSEDDNDSDSRLVVMAPSGSEVYIDDERYGSVGRSGRVILTSLAPGKHVLRVAKSGEVDDERLIEVRSDVAEQIIEAQLKTGVSKNQLTPSHGGSLDSRPGHSETLVVVMCTKCHSRFAEGVKFCGRCGNTTFVSVAEPATGPPSGTAPASTAGTVTCPRCQNTYSATIKFCGRCGIPIGTAALDWRTPKPVEVFCRGCGTSYPKGTKFCGRCGKAIVG